jgi:branched-chain amino acid transport system substrate-binding protein
MRLLKLLLTACFLFGPMGLLISKVQSLQNPSQVDKTVKIGMLIPDKNSVAAKHGAEMAISKANENGGFNGRHFELIVRSMEGPWGTGSKQAVDLIFEENVCAIMGSPDGRNGHLVEQVTTKARIVFLSTWASDPTLAQAFVPWYFSCVPTDLQQADAFIEEIYNKRKLTKIAAISDNDYDSKLALESFVKKTKQAGKPDPFLLSYENSNPDFNILIDKIRKADIGAIILFGKPSASVRLIQQLKQNKINKPLFGALSLLNEDELADQDLKYYDNVVMVASENLSGSKALTFREEFRKTYGKQPGAVAAYSFDGMSLLLEAIRKAGTDRIEIQKALTKIHFEGVTGPIQFDDKGKRMGTPDLIEIKKGIPVSVER